VVEVLTLRHMKASGHYIPVCVCVCVCVCVVDISIQNSLAVPGTNICVDHCKPSSFSLFFLKYCQFGCYWNFGIFQETQYNLIPSICIYRS